MARLSKNGAVVGATIYIDGELVAENVTFTPPAVSFASSEVQAHGALSIPTYQLPEAMECSVEFIGIDAGFIAALVGRDLECRWASTSVGTDGEQRVAGHKAFCRVIPKTVPAIGVGVGEPGTNSVSFDVLRYQLFVDGNEAVLIDKMTGDTRIAGQDLSGNLRGLL